MLGIGCRHSRYADGLEPTHGDQHRQALTIVLLLVLAAVIGVQDMRQVLYLSLHISACAT